MLLESFKGSHFHVKIGRKGRDISVSQTVESVHLGLLDEDGSDGENTAAALGCKTVINEDGEFESTRAGGVARAATSCWSLGNGDVVVGFFFLWLLYLYYIHSHWILKEVTEDRSSTYISCQVNN